MDGGEEGRWEGREKRISHCVRNDGGGREMKVGREVTGGEGNGGGREVMVRRGMAVRGWNDGSEI